MSSPSLERAFPAHALHPVPLKHPGPAHFPLRQRPPQPVATHGFGPLVGASPLMKRVYDQISRVAPTSATVLIVGESGTGKELVARTLHDLSRRRNEPYVALNCSSLSPMLIESELFGHEKGSFTGADRQH